MLARWKGWVLCPCACFPPLQWDLFDWPTVNMLWSGTKPCCWVGWKADPCYCTGEDAIRIPFGWGNKLCNVTDEDVKEHWSQYWSVRNTSNHPSPPRHWAIGHHSLGMISQPVSYPSNSPHNKSISFHFEEKDVMGDCVKGLLVVALSLSIILWVCTRKQSRGGAPPLDQALLWTAYTSH